MFCFCKNKTCFKSFNKIRRKGIKFQRFYLVRHMCKSKEISILKLTTREKSQLETFEVDRFETKNLATKIFLSKPKWKYLKKLRKECPYDKLENKDHDPVFKNDNDSEWEDIQNESFESELPNIEEYSQLEDTSVNQSPQNIQETPIDIKTEVQNLICEEDFSQLESNHESSDSDVEVTENVEEAIVIDSDSDENTSSSNDFKFEIEFDPNKPIEIPCLENGSRRKRKYKWKGDHQCEICGRCFPYKNDYDYHVSSFHSKADLVMNETPPNTNGSSSDSSEVPHQYQCLYCRKNFKLKNDYVAHTLLHFDSNSGKIIEDISDQNHSYKHDYRCFFCSKVYDLRSRVLSHIRIAHHRQIGKGKSADDYIRVREVIEQNNTVFQICHLSGDHNTH